MGYRNGQKCLQICLSCPLNLSIVLSVMNKIYQTLLTKTPQQLINIDQKLGQVVNKTYYTQPDIMAQILSDYLNDLQQFTKREISVHEWTQ